MERAFEGIAEVEASPEHVVRILSSDPAGVLTGVPSSEEGPFVAVMAVELGGGTSLVHDVDVVFDRRPDEGTVGCFGLSWRARDHQGAFPVFAGDLKVHPAGNGSRLRLSGRYSLPLGAVGAFGDRLLGHGLARRSIQGFLDAAATRIDAALTRGVVLGRELEPGASVAGPRTAPATVTIDRVHSELYLG